MAQEEHPLPPRTPVIHNAAVVVAIAVPLTMLLPPRKMDLRFFMLTAAGSVATNQLVYEYTGQSIYARFGSRFASVFEAGLPEGAKRTQQLLREQREREAAQKRSRGEAEPGKKGGLLKDIWMGGEGEDWSAKREEEHQRSFQEGKGLGDIILEQISDVWSGRWKAGAETRDDDKIPNRGGRSDKE